jgi:hypothetical protein
MTACPECGAPERLCEAQFHRFLALEYADAAYGAVHHLTVAAYMLQHSSNLTAEGWLFERDLLRRFLEWDASPSDVRRSMAAVVDGRRRAFKIKSPDGRPLFDRPAWHSTIMHVRHDEPGTYCSDIAAWARAALGDGEQVRLEKHET